MRTYSKWFIRVSAVYALAGAMLGSHMAGSSDLHLTATHAHILVVGWLTLFAYGVFYRLFPEPARPRVARWQAWSGLIGGGTMPLGMLAYTLSDSALAITVFISTASILLLAMILFVWIVFFDRNIFA